MCGIVGFVNTSLNKEETIKPMMDRIIHRGPNSAGQYIDNDIALGFRRLSIIDLEGGSQPIYNEDNTKIIIFNGEIYNYLELKEELLSAGHVFRTSADTEVILHGYEQWGEKVLDRLRGMFAFAIWDNEKKELFGARDHFGIKPYYYAQMNDTFMFGSEIKSFLPHPDFKKELNKEALGPFLTFQYSALGNNETFFKNVFRIGPGQYYTYKDQTLDIQTYWKPDYTTKEEHSKNEWIDLIDKQVIESINAHKISDVPVGSFLSSGVDSSYVTSVLKPDMSFSISFDDKTYNEASEAKKLADKLNIPNTASTINQEESFQAFPLIQYHLDEPDANPSCIPLYFLTKLAAKDYRVVQSGEGADELFIGYQSYGFLTHSKAIRVAAQTLKKISPKARHKLGRSIGKMKNFPGKAHLYMATADPAEHFIGHANIFNEDEKGALLKPAYQHAPTAKEIMAPLFEETKAIKEDVNKMQYVDFQQWMPKDILLKADKMAMANSLEVRTPLLDKEVMHLAQKMPSKYLLNEHNTKDAFRQAAHRHLPAEWANREKLGFPVPIKVWLREKEGYQQVKDIFSSNFAGEFFDQEYILNLLDTHYQEKGDVQRKIWTLYTFLTWYKVFFIDEAIPTMA